MLCPLKKHRFSDFRKKYLNENGIIETLENNASNNNAISIRNTSYFKNQYRLCIYFERKLYCQ
jgi:hypothetical protein